MKAWLGRLFDASAMDKEYPVLEGQTYLNFTEVTAHFATAFGINTRGAAISELLALRAHPQAFHAMAGTFVDVGDGETDRVLEFTELDNIGRLVAQMYYSAVLNLVQYHGHDTTEVEKWADQVATVFPGAFDQPSDGQQAPTAPTE